MNYSDNFMMRRLSNQHHNNSFNDAAIRSVSPLPYDSSFEEDEDFDLRFDLDDVTKITIENLLKDAVEEEAQQIHYQHHQHLQQQQLPQAQQHQHFDEPQPQHHQPQHSQQQQQQHSHQEQPQDAPYPLISTTQSRRTTATSPTPTTGAGTAGCGPVNYDDLSPQAKRPDTTVDLTASPVATTTKSGKASSPPPVAAVSPKSTTVHKPRRKKTMGVPKRPLSAANIFFMKERENVLHEYKGKKLGSDKLRKIIWDRWCALQENQRGRFNQAAEKDAVRYRHQMDAYAHSRGGAGGDPYPRSPTSRYSEVPMSPAAGSASSGSGPFQGFRVLHTKYIPSAMISPNASMDSSSYHSSRSAHSASSHHPPQQHQHYHPHDSSSPSSSPSRGSWDEHSSRRTSSAPPQGYSSEGAPLTHAVWPPPPGQYAGPPPADLDLPEEGMEIYLPTGGNGSGNDGDNGSGSNSNNPMSPPNSPMSSSGDSLASSNGGTTRKYRVQYSAYRMTHEQARMYMDQVAWYRHQREQRQHQL